MKNKQSVNEVLDLIESQYIENQNLKGLELLLASSGIEKDETSKFFIEAEVVSMHGDGYLRLNRDYVKDKFLLSNNEFLLSLATNLLKVVGEDDGRMLVHRMENDNILINDEKIFYNPESEQLSHADKESLKAIFDSNREIQWKCSVCGHHLDCLDSITKVEKYLNDFSVGKYKKCEKNRHPNKFVIKDGSIVYSSLPKSLEEASRIKKDNDKTEK